MKSILPFLLSRGLALAATLVAPVAAGGPLAAADTVPEAVSPKQVKPGATALLKSEKEMRYFLRVPASYHPRRGARMVVFLHGSNMNGLSYLRSFEARKWAPDDILVCPNGEQGEDPYGANNFTFGSAPFVAGVTEEVAAAFKVTRVYVGGHSQGGFVTYSVIMNYPDLYHGALPMAGDCWMQNEPNLWEDRPAVMEKQKKIAIAVIHGRRDPVVDFSQGQHAHDVFLAMGYPKLRLFAPERLGHEFMLSPVDEALAWLDSMVGDDPRVLAREATRYAKDGEWGWAVQASKRLAELERAPSAAKRAAASVLKGAERVAKQRVEAMAKAIDGEPAEKWLPRWYEFRRLFGETEAARPLVERYEKLRASQRAIGKRLFGEARGLFRAERKEEGRAKLREILEKAPATYEAHYALAWLDEKE